MIFWPVFEMEALYQPCRSMPITAAVRLVAQTSALTLRSRVTASTAFRRFDIVVVWSRLVARTFLILLVRQLVHRVARDAPGPGALRALRPCCGMRPMNGRERADGCLPMTMVGLLGSDDRAVARLPLPLAAVLADGVPGIAARLEKCRHAQFILLVRGGPVFNVLQPMLDVHRALAEYVAGLRQT